jgi:hypothetical protein
MSGRESHRYRHTLKIVRSERNIRRSATTIAATAQQQQRQPEPRCYFAVSETMPKSLAEQLCLMVWKHHDYPSISGSDTKKLSLARWYQCILNLGPASAAVSVGKNSVCGSAISRDRGPVHWPKSAVVFVLINNVPLRPRVRPEQSVSQLLVTNDERIQDYPGLGNHSIADVFLCRLGRITTCLLYERTQIERIKIGNNVERAGI